MENFKLVVASKDKPLLYLRDDGHYLEKLVLTEPFYYDEKALILELNEENLKLWDKYESKSGIEKNIADVDLRDKDISNNTDFVRDVNGYANKEFYRNVPKDIKAEIDKILDVEEAEYSNNKYFSQLTVNEDTSHIFSNIGNAKVVLEDEISHEKHNKDAQLIGALLSFDSRFKVGSYTMIEDTSRNDKYFCFKKSVKDINDNDFVFVQEDFLSKIPYELIPILERGVREDSIFIEDKALIVNENEEDKDKFSSFFKDFVKNINERVGIEFYDSKQMTKKEIEEDLELFDTFNVTIETNKKDNKQYVRSEVFGVKTNILNEQLNDWSKDVVFENFNMRDKMKEELEKKKEKERGMTVDDDFLR